MRTVILVLAPGRSITCFTPEEARDVLRMAGDAGLIASIASDGRTVRCEPLDRMAAPGLVESKLATERARVVELERQLLEAQMARQAAEARADEWARKYREIARFPRARDWEAA